MMRFSCVVALIAVGCSGAGAPSYPAESLEARVHEVRCGDLGRLEFYYTQPEVGRSGDAKSPWLRDDLVWLGDRTGISGRELGSLRVMDTPQSVFGPDDSHLPHSESHPLVPTVQLTFTKEGGQRFRALERTIAAEHDSDILRARHLALVVGGQILVSWAPWPPSHAESEVVREAEFKGVEFSQIVDFLESNLGCAKPRERRPTSG